MASRQNACTVPELIQSHYAKFSEDLDTTVLIEDLFEKSVIDKACKEEIESRHRLGEMGSARRKLLDHLMNNANEECLELFAKILAGTPVEKCRPKHNEMGRMILKELEPSISMLSCSGKNVTNLKDEYIDIRIAFKKECEKDHPLTMENIKERLIDMLQVDYPKKSKVEKDVEKCEDLTLLIRILFYQLSVWFSFSMVERIVNKFQPLLKTVREKLDLYKANLKPVLEESLCKLKDIRTKHSESDISDWKGFLKLSVRCGWTDEIPLEKLIAARDFLAENLGISRELLIPISWETGSVIVTFVTLVELQQKILETATEQIKELEEYGIISFAITVDSKIQYLFGRPQTIIADIHDPYGLTQDTSPREKVSETVLDATSEVSDITLQSIKGPQARDTTSEIHVQLLYEKGTLHITIDKARNLCVDKECMTFATVFISRKWFTGKYEGIGRNPDYKSQIFQYQEDYCKLLTSILWVSVWNSQSNDCLVSAKIPLCEENLLIKEDKWFRLIPEQEEVERANNRLRSYIQLFAKSQCNFCDFLSVDNEDIERLFSLAKFLTSRESDSPGPCSYSRVMMVHKLFSFKVNKQWKVIKTITTSTLDISKFEQYLKLHHPEECLEILHKT